MIIFKLYKSIRSILFQEGIRNFYIRKFRGKLKGKKWFVIHYRDLKIKILLKEKNGYVDQYIYKNGTYEKEIIDLIHSKINKDSVFVDIGANIGQHSLIISHYVKEVIAFEPLQFLADQFRQSVEKNNIKNIKIEQIGLGNRKETQSVYIDDNQSGYTTLLDHLEKTPGLRKNENSNLIRQEIKIDTLDNYLGNQKIHFIKMDIEGYEYYAILGAMHTIKSHKPFIIMEFSNMFYESHEKGLTAKFFYLLKSLDYTIKSLERNKIIETIEDIDFSKKQENYFLIPNS